MELHWFFSESLLRCTRPAELKSSKVLVIALREKEPKGASQKNWRLAFKNFRVYAERKIGSVFDLEIFERIVQFLSS